MEANIDLNNRERAMNKVQQKKFSIFAMFLSRKNVRNAIKSLKNHGYLLKDISLLTPEKHANHDFVYQQDTSIKSGALVGAVTGFFILGIIGFIMGLKDPAHLGTASRIIYTVLGMLIGLVFGAASGALVGIGTPKSAAKRYNFYLKEGGIVLMLHLKNEDDGIEANVILEKAGGQDLVVLEESQIWSTIMPENKRLTFH